MKCLRCDHEWTPRTNATPDRCPKCTSEKWNTAPPAAAKCAKCGHEWQPRIEPKKCAKCLTKYWRGETAPTEIKTSAVPAPVPVSQVKPTKKCPKCGNEWTPRTDAPKNCPKCKAPLDGSPRVSAIHGKVYAIRLAAMAGPVEPTDETLYVPPVDEFPGPAGLPELKICELIAAYEWTGPRVKDFPDGTPDIITDIAGLDPDEHYPVLELISGPSSGPLYVNDTYILRGWIRRENI